MPARDKPPLDQLDTFISTLPDAWSLQSSTLWTPDNPAAGHCGVTALVANDLFGGEILKTPYGAIWHFYNLIDGIRYDFTKAQFSELPPYHDVESSREEAFGDTNAAQYKALRNAVFVRMNGSGENL